MNSKLITFALLVAMAVMVAMVSAAPTGNRLFREHVLIGVVLDLKVNFDSTACYNFVKSTTNEGHLAPAFVYCNEIY